MADDLEFNLDVRALAARLAQLGAEMRQRAGNALRAEAEIEMTEAKRRTPVKYGVLKGSGLTTGPFIAGSEVFVRLTFGGAASGYAIYVHENTEAIHGVGQAKFLESVILESAPYLAQRVATRMSAGMSGVVF